MPMPRTSDASRQETEEEAELGMPQAALAGSQFSDASPVAK